MPEETKKNETIQISREEFRKAVTDAMSHSEFAHAMKEQPVMLLVIPLVGMEIEKLIFDKESDQ